MSTAPVMVTVRHHPEDPLRTFVALASGEELKGVKEVHFLHGVGGLPRVWLEVLNPGMDITATLSTKDRETARAYLDKVACHHHPSAGDDPVGALGHVAVDLKTAHGLLLENAGSQARQLERAEGVVTAARAAMRCAGGHKYADALAALWGAVRDFDAPVSTEASGGPTR